MNVVRTYPLRHCANAGKAAQVAALLPHWQAALTVAQAKLLRQFYGTGRIPRYLDTKTLESPLSQRQLKSVVNQARAACSSWVAGMVPKFRDLVTQSTLHADRKVDLYRLNKQQAWFRADTDRAPETLRLARTMFKHLARTRHRPPDLRSVRTMLMDGPIARVGSSRTPEFDYWLNIATLTKGKPVQVPLAENRHSSSASGELRNYAQVQVQRSGEVGIALVRAADAAAPRQHGRVLGLDWGLKSLFTTSEGQLLGMQLFDWLQDRDQELTALTRSLQQQRVRLRTNRRYQALQRRIREHVRNEVGRILNLIGDDDDVREIVVEKLHFRHGGLSRRLNRILGRAGRRAVEYKLQDLAETRGIQITHVNPAYSSQQCTGCWFTHKTNRKASTFKCRFCGKTLHADVNAARNLVARRSDDTTGGLYVSKQKIKTALDQRFQHRWRLADTGFDALAKPGLRRCSSPGQVPTTGLACKVNH